MAGYEAALDLWQISGVQKATARLIEGLELGAVPAGRQGGGWLGGGSGGPAFNLHFLTVIPYFKVTEVRAYTSSVPSFIPYCALHRLHCFWRCLPPPAEPCRYALNKLRPAACPAGL